MTLSALIKKGGLANAATATTATLATQEPAQQETVAPVATVAVAPEPWIKLSTDDESSIRAWLAHIEETLPEIIAEVLEQCRADPDALRYFLHRAEEVPKTALTSERVSCGDCASFHRTDHPNLGHCAEGEPEAIAGLWDSDKRYCGRYLRKPEPHSGDKSD